MLIFKIKSSNSQPQFYRVSHPLPSLMSWKERESVNKITQSSVCSMDKDLALSIMYENLQLIIIWVWKGLKKSL